jgi:hypothetical protein
MLYLQINTRTNAYILMRMHPERACGRAGQASAPPWKLFQDARLRPRAWRPGATPSPQIGSDGDLGCRVPSWHSGHILAPQFGGGSWRPQRRLRQDGCNRAGGADGWRNKVLPYSWHGVWANWRWLFEAPARAERGVAPGPGARTGAGGVDGWRNKAVTVLSSAKTSALSNSCLNSGVVIISLILSRHLLSLTITYFRISLSLHACIAMRTAEKTPALRWGQLKKLSERV